MLLHADFPADLTAADPAGADADALTVTGVAVPWDTIGHTSAGPVRFTRGSLPADGPVPLCRDHDLAAPVGVVTSWSDDDDALRFTARLDDIPAGRDVRVQMRSGSRSGVSVGVDVTDSDTDADGTLVVLAATWVELSSVVAPAFTAARVAAARRRPAQPDPNPDLPAPPADPMGEQTMTDPTSADAPAVVPDQVRQPRVSVAPNVLALSRAVHAAVRAGDPSGATILRAVETEYAAAVRAALADTTSGHVPGQGTWLSQLDNYVALGMPVAQSFGVRAPDRWPVHQLELVTKPVPDVQGPEKTEIATNAASTSWAELDSDTYAWGTDVSVQVMEDSPDALAQIIEVAGDQVGQQIDAAFVTALVGAAGNPTSGGVTMATLGTAIGKVAATGLLPDRIIAAPDVYGKLYTLLHSGGLGIATGPFANNFPTPVPVLAATAPAGTCIVAASRAAKLWASERSELRAYNVQLLGADVGVYRRAVPRVSIPAALVKITT